MWTIDQIEINGGFLPGLKTALPNGLICIIGPRGSGKSTLAETLRFALKGSGGGPKKRLDLLQANLGNSGLVTLALTTDAALKHTLRRGLKQPPVLLNADTGLSPASISTAAPICQSTPIPVTKSRASRTKF